MVAHTVPCGGLMARFPAAPRDEQGCCRPEGHAGPHLSMTSAGAVEWEVDLECDCEHCLQCEGDYCEIYWPYTPPPQAADTPTG